MNTNKDILKAELKNLYALEKQILSVFPIIEKNISNKELKKLVHDFHKSASSDMTYIHSALKSRKINSGNTVDQIVKEIVKNLKQISKADYPQEIKDLGVATSLLRLNSYKAACYEISFRMAKITNEDKKLSSKLKDKRDKNEEFAKEVKKVIKKQFQK